MGLLAGKKSYAMEIATKPLIMASEISGLEPLRAFFKRENQVAPVRFQLAKKRGGQPEFIERRMPALAPRPALSMPAVPVELPRKPAQAALPFADPPAAQPKKVYVWDESKGID